MSMCHSFPAAMWLGRLCVVAALSVVVTTAATATATAANGVLLATPVLGPTELVRNSTGTFNCGQTSGTLYRNLDIPDLPARAWFANDSTTSPTTLLSSWAASRLDHGPSLDNLHRDCRVVFNSSWNTDPSFFDDRTWLDAPYFAAGGQGVKTVYALAHMEFHGWTDAHPKMCNNKTNPEPQYCWYNAVVLLKSVDGGQTFSHARPPPEHLVAAAPYVYTPSTPSLGYGDMSNVIEHNGYLYAFIHARRDVGAVRAGACLMRTAVSNFSDPASWRAWGGESRGFAVRFINPYREKPDDPAEHACVPVPSMSFLPLALAFNTFYGRFMATGEGQYVDPGTKQRSVGYQIALSDDLVHWDPPTLLRVKGPSDNYAAILDDTASRGFGRNIDRVAKDSGYLYFTQTTREGCSLPFGCRNIYRQGIEFQ
eukprot:m.252526 g.252526  ORF g.252526 m.252526 type:complete len:425 (+) comp19126_c0_seq13:1865-3139(+)